MIFLCSRMTICFEQLGVSLWIECLCGSWGKLDVIFQVWHFFINHSIIVVFIAIMLQQSTYLYFLFCRVSWSQVKVWFFYHLSNSGACSWDNITTNPTLWPWCCYHIFWYSCHTTSSRDDCRNASWCGMYHQIKKFFNIPLKWSSIFQLKTNLVCDLF